MALTVADPGIAVQQGDDAEALPNVMTTPCGDTWPRPYYLEKGLRRVQPYFFTYNTHAKGRWRDREILDIFESEFRGPACRVLCMFSRNRNFRAPLRLIRILIPVN